MLCVGVRVALFAALFAISLSGTAIADIPGGQHAPPPPPAVSAEPAVSVEQLTAQMMNRIGHIFGKMRQSRQEMTVSNPTPHTTQIQLRWPNCIRGTAALLGTFCVLPTTKEMEADPSNLLPRFSVQVEAEPTSQAAVFLFDDDDEAYMALFRSGKNISSCNVLAEMSSAAIFASDPARRTVQGTRSIRTASAHKWYIVAADCSKASVACSNVSHASLQYFHPAQDTALSTCYTSGALSNLRDMKEWVSEALAVDYAHLFTINAISPFGVSVLYTVCVLMLSCTVLFWGMTKWEQDPARKGVYLRCTVAVAVSAAAYLTIASGNGFLVLRKVGAGPAAGWVYSSDILNDALSPEQREDTANTYPFLWIRYVELGISTPLQLYTLFALTDLPQPTVMLGLFCNSMMMVCWAEAAAVNAPSEWAFALLASLFAAATIRVVQGGFGATSKRSRPTRRLFTRLASIIIPAWALLPFIWIVGDGTRALPIDLLLILYLMWDVLVKCVFGLILLRNLPDIGTLLESYAHELESVGLTSKAAHESGVGYDDESGPGPARGGASGY